MRCESWQNNAGHVLGLRAELRPRRARSVLPGTVLPIVVALFDSGHDEGADKQGGDDFCHVHVSRCQDCKRYQ